MFQFLKEKKSLLPELALCIPVAIVVGSLVALFLFLLDCATKIRIENEWLTFLLPLAGLLIYFIYKKKGRNAEAGNNLILEEIQHPQQGVPGKMAPLILGSTLITHLFGGSAGREGTAVQMGGSIAHWVASKLHISGEIQRNLLYAGMAAGFGAVFGTPFAGAIFAIEVVAIGTLHYKRLLSCLMAAWLAHIVCISWGIQHTVYPLAPDIKLTYKIFAWVIPAGICFGLCSLLFVQSTHRMKVFWNTRFPQQQYWIPLIGGMAIVLLSLIPGARDYLGLGVYPSRIGGASIQSAFQSGGATEFSWLWKLLLTAITISSGFKGGEVTPLFFIGATLGNTLATLSGTPADLMASLGFLAVFAGAANTPLACTIMGIELFGTEYTFCCALACYTAYLVSGHKGIYSSQAIHRRKWRLRSHKKTT